MIQYLEIVDKVLKKGVVKRDRTGTGTLAIFGAHFEHNMSQGFPLLTTKKMAHKSMRVELEGFIKGVTDKKWYESRGCKIWNYWCNPKIVPYGNNKESKKRMREENDLGPIYGFQWRHFGAEYLGCEIDYTGVGIDQLVTAIRTLKMNPDSRKVVINAWNPMQLGQMALEPCHYSFQFDIIDNRLNLSWNQRSVDTMLGLPFNIASYGLLLEMVSKETGYSSGKLVGNLGDTHIYMNHVEGAKEQLIRKPLELCRVELPEFTSVFNWEHNDVNFVNYQSHGKLGRDVFPISV